MGAGRTARIGVVAGLICLLALAWIPSAGAAKRLRVKCTSGSLFGPEHTVVTLPGPLEPAIAGSFAVLRRATGPEDQLPQLNPVEEELRSELAGYYPESVRQLLRFPDGRRYFLVVGLPQIVAVPPAACLPAQLRARRRSLVEQQQARAKVPVYCVATVGEASSFSLISLFQGGACHSFKGIYRAEGPAANAFSTSLVVEIVPDGVAAVRLGYRDGMAITATVSEDVYAYTPPRDLVRHAESVLARSFASPPSKHLSKSQRKRRERRLIRLIERTFAQLVPAKVQWLGPSGQVLRTMTPSGASSAPAILNG